MRVMVLTGAGISAESGLSTFRGAGGLWEGHRVEEVATPEAFERDPDLVYTFYNMRRRSLQDVAPNAAHEALYRLEQALGKDFLLVTQNVDDLHDRCGHERILHMHGRLDLARNQLDEVMEWPGDMDAASRCPSTATRVRPHIVWFGEVPLHMDEIQVFLPVCDVFCAIGTSGVVYPAAGFVEAAAYHRAHTVEINLEATGGRFAEVRTGPATEVVPRWVDELLAQ